MRSLTDITVLGEGRINPEIALELPADQSGCRSDCYPGQKGCAEQRGIPKPACHCFYKLVRNNSTSHPAAVKGKDLIASRTANW